jgi:hypothetical protein
VATAAARAVTTTITTMDNNNNNNNNNNNIIIIIIIDLTKFIIIIIVVVVVLVADFTKFSLNLSTNLTIQLCVHFSSRITNYLNQIKVVHIVVCCVWEMHLEFGSDM